MSDEQKPSGEVRAGIKSDLAPDDPLLIFTNAFSYDLAGEILGQHEAKSLFLFPAHVCKSLALELYIKCLRRVRGLETKRIHKIVELLEGINDEDLATISKHLFNYVSQHPQYVEYVKNGVDFDIFSIAKRSTDAFERVRYWHELKITSTDDKGFAGNPGLGNLCDAFRRMLLELNPDWREKVEGFTVQPLYGPQPTSPAH